MVVAETVVSDSKQNSSHQYRSSRALAVMDNIETFHHKKIIDEKTLISDSKQASFQISPDDLRLLLSWTALTRFAIRQWLLQKLLVSDSKQIF